VMLKSACLTVFSLP